MKNRKRNVPTDAEQPLPAATRRTVTAVDWVIRGVTLFVVLTTLLIAWTSFTRIERDVTSGEGDYLPRHLQETTVLSQLFVATHSRIGTVALAFEGDTSQDTEIAIRLYETDFAGNKLNPGEPLFDTVLTSEEIAQHKDSVIPVGNLRLKVGTPLLLEIVPQRLDDQTLLSIQTVSSRFGGLTENDRALQTIALYSVISYHSFDYLAFVICALLAVLVVLLAFNRLGFIDRWVARSRFYPLFIAPLLLLIVMELLNTLNTNGLLSVKVLVLSYLLLLGFIFFFFFLVRHGWTAVFLTSVLWITFATVNHTKIYFRGDPFFAGDLLLAGEAVTSLDNLSFHVSPRLLAAILILIACFLLFRTTRWRPSFSWRLPAAAAGIAVAIGLFIGLVIANDAVMQDTLQINRYTWNQMTNYKHNGFALAFTGSLANLSVSTPDYDPADLDGFYDLPSGSGQDPDDRPHIIVIMSESYTDFRNIKELPVSEPVMPYFDELTGRPDVISGNLLSSVFGGGTCNTEFEFLTGGSMLFLQDGMVPYRNFMHRPTHSIPEMLSEQGYWNVAVHPYLRTFWDRDRVYPNLGFDRFISMENMEDAERIRRFISDRDCFERIIEEFEQTPSGQRMFMYSITMQNHFPYYPDEGDLEDLAYHIKLNGLTDMEPAELFLSLLRESDDALAYLVEYFESQDEPVILVFFGDHLPGNNQELMPFYQYLFEGEIADLDIEETRKLYETPYFIWSNRNLPDADMPLTSPNLLGAYVMELAGVQKTPYFDFVHALSDSISAMNTKTVVDTAGNPHDRTALPADLQQLLDRYWVYSYDNIVRDQP